MITSHGLVTPDLFPLSLLGGYAICVGVCRVCPLQVGTCGYAHVWVPLPYAWGCAWVGVGMPLCGWVHVGMPWWWGCEWVCACICAMSHVHGYEGVWVGMGARSPMSVFASAKVAKMIFGPGDGPISIG